jgi:CRP/FNR family cyclic AMP-dependent transcriptional regulator
MAAQPLVLLAIGKDDFETLLRRHPDLAVRFAKHLANIVRELVSNTKVLIMEDVYGRVAWWLSKRAQPVDGKLVTDRLTHESIGRRVGATREMVGRVLRELAAGGYISSSGGRYTLMRKLPRHR